MGDEESASQSMRAFLVNTLKSSWSVWGGRLVKIDSFEKLVSKKTVWQKIDGVFKTSTINFHTVKSQKPLYGGLHYSMICCEQRKLHAIIYFMKLRLEMSRDLVLLSSRSNQS